MIIEELEIFNQKKNVYMELKSSVHFNDQNISRLLSGLQRWYRFLRDFCLCWYELNIFPIVSSISGLISFRKGLESVCHQCYLKPTMMGLDSLQVEKYAFWKNNIMKSEVTEHLLVHLVQKTSVVFLFLLMQHVFFSLYHISDITIKNFNFLNWMSYFPTFQNICGVFDLRRTQGTVLNKLFYSAMKHHWGKTNYCFKFSVVFPFTLSCYEHDFQSLRGCVF